MKRGLKHGDKANKQKVDMIYHRSHHSVVTSRDNKKKKTESSYIGKNGVKKWTRK